MQPVLLLPQPRGCHRDIPSAAARSRGPRLCDATRAALAGGWLCGEAVPGTAAALQSSGCVPQNQLSFTHALPISRTRSALPSRTLGASQSPLLPALGLRVHLLTGTVTQPGTGSWGGVGQRAAWQEDFLTSGLGLQRTLELPGCTGVILVLALSSWAGSRHAKPVFRCGAGTLSRSLRQEWSPRVI